MATPVNKTSPQDNILNCPICMDIYKTPRMLPCQHTLCESCLHSYIVNKSRERVLVSDFPCPVCRTSTPAPKAFTRIDLWASLFPLNHLLVSLLDTNLFHERLVADTSHSEKCTEHPVKQIEFFCVDHETVICSKCFKNAHRHCNVNDIEEHLELTTRQTLVKLDIENIQKYLNDVIAHLKANMEQLATQRGNILQEVKEFKTKVDNFLTSLETDIKEQVKMHHDGAIIVLKSHCEKYERIKAEVESSEKTLDDITNYSDFNQAVASLTSLENEVKGHSNVLESCKSSVKVAKLNFALATQLSDFLNSLGQLGTVYVDQYEAELPPLEDILSKPNGEQLVPSPRGVVVTPVQQTSSPRSRSSTQGPTSQTDQEVPTQCTQQRRSYQGQETTQRSRRDNKRHSTISIGSACVTPIVVRPLAGRPHALNLSLDNNLQSEAASQPINTSPPSFNLNNFRAINSPQSAEPLTTSDDPLPEFLENLATLRNATSSPMSDAEEIEFTASGMSNSNHGVDPSTTITAPDIYENTVGVQYRIIRKVDSRNNPRRIDSSSDDSESTNGIETKLRRPSRTSSESDHMQQSDGATALQTNSESDEEIKSVKAHKICSIPVKVSKDTHECTITGATLLPEGRIVLVDCNNSRVKLMSKDFTCQSYVDMSKEPWNVANTSPNEVAVTVPLEKCIHVIRVLDTKMTLLRRIVTRFECWGVSHVSGLLAISTKDDGNAIVFLDKSGVEVQRINFDAHKNTGVFRPVSITYNPRNHRLLVCCEGHSGTKGSLVSMTVQGQIINVYSDKDMDRPYSSAIDFQNRILVTGIRSSSVILLSSEGEKIGTLLTRDNGLSRPQHIQVLHDMDKCRILLSERRSENVILYDIK